MKKYSIIFKSSVKYIDNNGAKFEVTVIVSMIGKTAIKFTWDHIHKKLYRVFINAEDMRFTTREINHAETIAVKAMKEFGINLEEVITVYKAKSDKTVKSFRTFEEVKA